MTSITKQLAPYLEDALPELWDIYTVEASLNYLERPAVLLSYTSSSVHWLGNRAAGKRYEVQMTYVSPVTSDLDAADEDLWNAEETVEEALQALPFVELTNSQRGTYGQTSDGTASNFAHIFTLTIGIPYE